MIIHICDLCGKNVNKKEIVTIQFNGVDTLNFLDICPDCVNKISGKVKAIREAQEQKEQREGATE